MTLRARVSFVKRVARRRAHLLRAAAPFAAATTVATLPLGYADGVPRRLSSTGGAVLVGGRRRPIVGVVTMDQLMVDCGDDAVARRRRGGADRAAGRRVRHRRRVGRAARHDRVRDHLRHRRPRPPCTPSKGPRTRAGSIDGRAGASGAGRRGRGDVHPVPAGRGPHAASCSAWATRRRRSCSSARDRAPRRIARACRSSAAAASCSTA